MTPLLVVMLLTQAPEVVPGARFEKSNKPSGLMPEHQRVAVGEYGKLDIVPVPAWEQLFAAEPKVAAECVTEPAAALKKLLKTKGVPQPKGEMPLLGCLDAGAPFTVQVRRVKIGKVEGLLYVTQLFIEPVLTNNGALQAWFQGLSDDGKTYVVGAFKVKAKGLRDEEGELLKGDVANKQIAADAEMLGKLKSSDFTPPLDTLAAALAKVKLP